MTWNLDISEAPRGEVVTDTRQGKNGPYEVERFVPTKVILAVNDSDIVTVSHWIPKEERWYFLAKGEKPHAWMPFPKHPLGGASG